MDDESLHDWASNDEGLYDLMTAYARKWGDDVEQREYDWCRENRQLIEEVASSVMSGAKPAHYLKYGG